MKMFFAVFFAILAAAAVIFAVLSAKSKIDARQQAAIPQFDAAAFAKSIHVQADVKAIKTQLQLYESMNGFFPSTEQGLQALVSQPQSDPRPTRWYQIFKELPKDPWGSDYIYRNPGLKNPGSYDLYSAGPDRQPDTPDDDWGGP